MASQTNIQGNKSLAAVIHALTERGFEVFLPLGDGTAIDLIMAFPDGPLIRVQVKTGRIRTGKYSRRVVFDTATVHWTKKSKTGYLGKADLFIAWCPETSQCYCVPVREAGLSSFSIAINDPAPFDLKGFDFDLMFSEISSPCIHAESENTKDDKTLRPVLPPRVNRNLAPSKQGRVRDYVIRAGKEGFRLHDAKSALPDISGATIQLVLASMRREGLVEMGPLSSLNTTWWAI